uniref:Uncharacterized protein n=1 Tax=Molossus molossus TaxID=27622 RepID=A0A7J8GS03_MOLMO|nr:hypothetical protein HJG59_011402 [Molossus molossus]
MPKPLCPTAPWGDSVTLGAHATLPPGSTGRPARDGLPFMAGKGLCEPRPQDTTTPGKGQGPERAGRLPTKRRFCPRFLGHKSQERKEGGEAVSCPEAQDNQQSWGWKTHRHRQEATIRRHGAGRCWSHRMSTGRRDEGVRETGDFLPGR